MKLRLIFLLSLFTAIAHAQTKADEKQVKLAEKHKSWINCFVVLPSGDTTLGRVQGQDFSFVTRDFTQPSGILLALNDESEVKLSASEVVELCVLNRAGGYIKYLSISVGKQKLLHKVVVDGTCCLLYSSKEGFVATPNSPAISVVTEKYTVYYKSALSDGVNGNEVSMIPASFRKKCGKIFADCPEMATQIESNDYKSDNLYEIVRAFNQCISGR